VNRAGSHAEFSTAQCHRGQPHIQAAALGHADQTQVTFARQHCGQRGLVTTGGKYKTGLRVAGYYGVGQLLAPAQLQQVGPSDAAFDAVAFAGKVGTQLFGGGHQRHGALHQASALVIEFERTALSVKQLGAQFGLQALQRFGHRAGCQAQCIGGQRQVLVLGHGQEMGQRGQVNHERDDCISD
jgi:hypothetical protein